MTCIYQKSKYYAQAQLDPLSIIEPIGYKYLNDAQKPKPLLKKREGEAVPKSLTDITLTKLISARGTAHRDVEKYMKLTPSNNRKNYNLNGQNLQFVNRNLNTQSLAELREAYFPSKSKQAELLSFLQVLSATSILKDVLLSIRDYSLSTFMVYYQGENLMFYNYLQKMIDEEFIEYDNEILINSPALSRPQLRKIDYTKEANVTNYVKQITQIGTEKDQLFRGVHLYVSDTLPQIQPEEDSSILREEAQLWPWLQYQITLVAGILNDGQHAIIKIGGTFTQKTIQYLYILKLCFNRVYLHKNLFSNPFTNDKYVVCQFCNKENARSVHRMLLSCYEKVLKDGQNVVLIDIKAIYLNDFHTNINDFNNLSPVIKISKETLRELFQNCNSTFYPTRDNVMKKIQKLKIKNIQEIEKIIEELIPETSEKKKVQKAPIIIEKQAQLFDFEAMGALCMQSAKQAEARRQKKLLDLSRKEKAEDQAYIKQYIQTGDQLMKQKKEQAKKKKAKQKQDKL